MQTRSSKADKRVRAGLCSPTSLKGPLSLAGLKQSREKADENQPRQKRVEEEYRLRPKKKKINPPQRSPPTTEVAQLAFQSNTSSKANFQDENRPSRRLLHLRSNEQPHINIARSSSIPRGLRATSRKAGQIAQAQTQNQILKKNMEEMLSKLRELEKQFQEETVRFERQEKSYERHIATLRGQVDTKKNELAHLHFFPSLNPATLVVRPIVEVQEQSSLLKTLMISKATKGQEGVVTSETACEGDVEELLLMMSSVH